MLFLEVQSLGEALLWPDSPPFPFFALVVATAGGLAIGLCLHVFGGHVLLFQQSPAEFQKTGRFKPRRLPAGLLAIYLSLIFGASLGPEVAAIDVGGSMGTLAGDRLRGRVRMLSNAGIVGALAGFAIYLQIARTTGGALYPLPPPGELLPLYLLYATIFGLAGGSGFGIAGTVSSLVLFSGQNEFRIVLDMGATAGASVLFLLVMAKIFASTWRMATNFKGAPIFPLTFAGGTPGLAVMTGMIVCVLKMPTAVIPLVTFVFLQWEILIIVAIAAVAGYYATRSVVMFPHKGSGGGDRIRAIRSESPPMRWAHRLAGR